MSPLNFSVDVVVPVFDGLDFVKTCLKYALANARFPARYIITDDCSKSTELRQYLRVVAERPNVVVRRNDIRKGYTANANLGAAEGNGDVIVFLNSDTIPGDGWLRNLVAEFVDPDIGVVGARLLYPRERDKRIRGRIQHAGVARNPAGDPYHIYWNYPANDPKVTRRLEINAVTGACMAVRRDIFESLGGFDEKAYPGGQYEDVDFCWQVRTLGLKVIYQPKACLFHYEHGSGTRFVAESTQRNRQRLFDRWGNLGSDEYLFGEEEGFFSKIAFFEVDDGM